VRSLTVLVRLARHRIDERRRDLIAAERRLDTLAEQERRADEALRREQGLAGADWTVRHAYDAFLRTALERRKALRAAREDAQRVREEAEAELMAEFATRKRYEALAAAEQARRERQARGREQAILDEMATSSVGRRAR